MFRSLPLQVGVDASDLAVALVLVGAAVVLGYRAVAVVDEGERGVLLASGSVRRVLEPGYHLVSPVGSTVEHVDVRRRTLPIPTREAVTSDDQPVTVDATVDVSVADAGQAVSAVDDCESAVTDLATTSLRAVVGSMPLEAVHEDRDELAERVRRELARPASQWGVDVEAVDVRSVESGERPDDATGRGPQQGVDPEASET